MCVCMFLCVCACVFNTTNFIADLWFTANIFTAIPKGDPRTRNLSDCQGNSVIINTKDSVSYKNKITVSPSNYIKIEFNPVINNFDLNYCFFK